MNSVGSLQCDLLISNLIDTIYEEIEPFMRKLFLNKTLKFCSCLNIGLTLCLTKRGFWLLL